MVAAPTWLRPGEAVAGHGFGGALLVVSVGEGEAWVASADIGTERNRLHLFCRPASALMPNPGLHAISTLRKEIGAWRDGYLAGRGEVQWHRSV